MRPLFVDRIAAAIVDAQLHAGRRATKHGTTGRIPLKSEGNWAVVSGDRKITRVPHERAAWRESGLTVFFLERGWSRLRYWDICWRLVRWWPTILVHAQTTEAGVSYLVPITSTKLRVLR